MAGRGTGCVLLLRQRPERLRTDGCAAPAREDRPGLSTRESTPLLFLLRLLHVFRQAALACLLALGELVLLAGVGVVTGFVLDAQRRAVQIQRFAEGFF